MTGRVDSAGRALLPIRLRHSNSGSEIELDAWIDSAFSGELVVPNHLIAALKLPIGPSVKARLADGSEVDVDTFTSFLEWFGNSRRIEVIASQGEIPLLGIGLLFDRVLTLDYAGKSVILL